MTAPTASSLTLTYPRDSLLAIASSASGDTITAPSPDDLAGMAEILRHGSISQWGVDESMSDILNDTEPIAKALIRAASADTEGFRIGGTPEVGSDSGSLLFSYSSLDIKPPVMVDFLNPFSSFNTNKAIPRKASTAFQLPPLSRTSSVSSDSSTRAIHLGEKYTSLRDSRSSSISSSFSSSPILRKGSLNPFAAPFPLPTTTPGISKTAPEKKDISAIPIPSLPLPKSLPAFLPAKPGPLAPVYVKKESATLPQPMALPTVKPMSEEWLGNDNVSGNEKRRRASQVEGEPQPAVKDLSSIETWRSRIPAGSVVESKISHSQSLGEKRPERLVKLGQGLRQSIALKSMRAGP